MNLINSIKEKIKVMLESSVDTNTTENQTEVKFIDAKTSDGKILHSEGESFVVGAKVSYMNEDGTLSDVEDGTYTLEDGSTLTTVGSVITEVMEASDDTTEAAKAVEASSVELSKQLVDVTELLSTLTDEMVNLKKEIATLKTEKVEMKKQIEKIADEPATEQRKKSDKKFELKKELRPSEIISQLRGI